MVSSGLAAITLLPLIIKATLKSINPKTNENNSFDAKVEKTVLEK